MISEKKMLEIKTLSNLPIGVSKSIKCGSKYYSEISKVLISMGFEIEKINKRVDTLLIKKTK